MILPRARRLARTLDEPARSTFRRDRRAEIANGVFLVGLFATKDVVAPQFFGAGYFVLAMISTGNFLGLLLSMSVGVLADRGDKVRLVVRLEGLSRVALLLFPLLLFVPEGPPRQAALAVLIGAGLLLFALPTPARLAIYHENYPANVRGRLFGINRQARQGLVVFVTLALVLLWDGARSSAWFGADGAVLPRDSVYVILPVIGLVGLWGTWQFSRIRVAADDRRAHAAALAPAVPRLSFLRATGQAIGGGARGVVRVLRTDRRFAIYMLIFFPFGLGNLMLNPVLPVYIRDLGADVFEQGLLMMIVPNGMVFLLLALSGRLFDRVHQMLLRGFSCLLFACVPLILLLSNDLTWIGVAMGVRGVAFSAGMVLWTLGTLYFAPADKVAAYMGVHVFLTGVRGVIAPQLGGYLAANVGVQATFGVSLGLMLVPALGMFVFAWHDLKRGHWGLANRPATPDAEPPVRDPAPATAVAR